jgi:8-oxo-dGTP pyrophosphatase MutT (NUDIX family)
MLRFGDGDQGVAAKDAATLVLLRDSPEGVRVFCVERHQKSAFLGGAIVFPGGKVDASDRDPAWAEITGPPRDAPFAADGTTARALAIAACRETLEEATILPAACAPLPHDALVALRMRLSRGEATLLSWLTETGCRLDLARLLPFSRWITPTAETRRYDTRFFLAIAGQDERGAHDERETTDSFWATPAALLARFDAGTVALMPPTHRTLSLLKDLPRAADAEALAAASCKDPICPELVPQGDTLALTLPGDPAHPVRTPRSPGASRFVLRGTRWLPEDAP